MGFFVYRHLGLVGRNIVLMKHFLPLLIILPLLIWVGCEEDEATGRNVGVHPFAGTWKVTDYCVYESANCDSNCNNQEFIPIFYIANLVTTYRGLFFSEGRVIRIDGMGDAGSINFSWDEQNFTVGSDAITWEFGSIPGSEYVSGTCILNDDNNTLELIYHKYAQCIRSTSEGWDGSIWMAGSDSIECYDKWIINIQPPFDNDTTYYYFTWIPEYCAKSTLTKLY